MSFGFSSTTGGAVGASGGEQEPRAQPGLDVFVSAGLAIDVPLEIAGVGTLAAPVAGTARALFGRDGRNERLVFTFLVSDSPCAAHPPEHVAHQPALGHSGTTQ